MSGIYNLSGMEMACTDRLPDGIYIVRYEDERRTFSKKVSVRSATLR
ncbi:MAG: T9SS type A sorting domain-containing protein [Muribaculaceae bacterium]|nr:T9SS type A sorting domain-containing protein [Muribaculaceae bacterium]